MSAKGGVGMKIDLDRVPTRQSNMEPFEILLSESQERMLIVCHKGKEQALLKVFEKWDLECEQIGEVTGTGMLEFYSKGELVAEVPADSLVLGGGAPVYDRDYTTPSYFKEIANFDPDSISVPEDYSLAIRKLLSSPNIASKKWVTDQYDGTVRTNSISESIPTNAAIIRLKGKNKALVACTDCNAAYVYADPYVGAMIAVSEAARNIIASGGKPMAITNCLNFGNPYNPEVYYQFVHAIKGMGEACKKYGTPVTGGNVSFYNQTVLKDKTEPVYPTPTIGMLGVMDDLSNIQTLSFQAEGDLIYQVGASRNDLGSSEYIRHFHGIRRSPVPYFDLDEGFANAMFIHDGIREKLFASVHDVSDGGLFVSLFESSLRYRLGFEVNQTSNIRKDSWLFGEAQGRFVVSVNPENVGAFESFAERKQIVIEKLGMVAKSRIKINGEDMGTMEELVPLYNETIGHFLEKAI
jgi:phosphoribosylformylglycinamidine synthase